MKSIPGLLVLFIFAGCAPKTKWDKNTVVNKCLKTFNEKNEKEKLLTTLQVGLLCDCVAEKMVAKYKTEREADRDEEGSREVGQSCAKELMGE